MHRLDTEGTGKTFTALRLAERLVGAGGAVLFLVPSISLLSQSLREWATEAELPLAPLAVCSDRKATARSKATNADISAVDLALPATTNVAVLVSRLTQAMGQNKAMTVLFATYQSIDVVAQAQQSGGLRPFDLIICDEAHRTTGTTLADRDESAFVRVHDNDYLHGLKRLYMTANPRIYEDSSKAKAGEANAVLASMDDEAVYGPEFHRLGFGEAVGRDLLTDYKVLVLAVDETAIAKTFQSQLSDDGGELNLDDAAKIVGCWNGLAKKGSSEHSFDTDPAPMRRAVAFSGTIAASKKIEDLFAGIVEQYATAHDVDDDWGDPPLNCEVRHVDGSFNALERNTRLDWLKADVPDGTCRILTNARCLSEGVKDDIFFYVCGLLHSPDYRQTYAADLTKMLPRIPLVEDAQSFIDAGRRLSELHLGYESVERFPLEGLNTDAPVGEAAYEHFRVRKMGFAKHRG